MGTKSTKKSEVATPAAKLPPKRKVASRPAAAAAPRKAAVTKTKKTTRSIEPETPATPAVLAAAPEIFEVPTEIIALRAYYIGEARQAHGQPGDSLTDWLEAERQIRAELK